MTPDNKMLPAAMLAIALSCLPLASSAGTITTQHGSKCRQQGQSTYSHAFKAVNGLWNYTDAPMNVACPLIRVGPTGSGGLRAWVDGYAPSGSRLECTLISADYDGLQIAGATFTLTGTGANFDRRVELPKATVPTYSSQLVWCTLPPGGAIYDIEPENMGS
jgi:hypothetical protein